MVDCLRVDPLFPGTLKRDLSVTADTVHRPVFLATLEATSMRVLRVAVHALVGQVDLILRTLEEFGDESIPQG